MLTHLCSYLAFLVSNTVCGCEYVGFDRFWHSFDSFRRHFDSEEQIVKNSMLAAEGAGAVLRKVCMHACMHDQLNTC